MSSSYTSRRPYLPEGRLAHDPQMFHNPVRRAGIYSLPVELLTRIFVLGAGYDFPYAESPFLLKPDQDYYAVPSSNFQLLVSHVCHHWRQIALQTSSLWSLLHFREPGHLARAKEYLSRCPASHHLVDILVDTVAERDHIPGVTLCREEIHLVFDIICPYVKQWRAFHLKVRDHACKAAARQHLSSCGPAPNLETLQLYHFEDYLTSQNLYLATYRPPVMVFSNGLPRLKNVSLIGVNLPWAQSPYLVGLHNLELALHPESIRPPYEFWESMLRNSPDLRTLSLHYSGPQVANGDVKLAWPTNKERIHIGSLESLSLTDLDPDYLCRLMGRIVLPGLKQLSLDLPDQDFTSFIQLVAGKKYSSRPTLPPNCPTYLPFPSLCKLDTLILTALEASRESLRCFFRALGGLRTLEIRFASVSGSLLSLLMEEGQSKLVDAKDELRTEMKLRTVCTNSETEPISSPRTLADCKTSASTFTRGAPLFPCLETFRLSGLPGDRLEALIQYRESYNMLSVRPHGDHRSKGYGIRNWIVQWSERRKGKDVILDQLVEQGWIADDGSKVYLGTFDEDEVDDEEADVDDEVEEQESEDDTSDSDSLHHDDDAA